VVEVARHSHRGRGQDVVDRVEVVADGVEATGLSRDLDDCLRKVIVDVRIHAEKEVLEDQQFGIFGDVPCRLPTFGTGNLPPPRLDVQGGEGLGEVLHPFGVTESSIGDRSGNVFRHATAERREVPAGVGGGAGDDNKFVGGLGNHRVSAEVKLVFRQQPVLAAPK
jgi:hypothetical protein